GFVRWAQMVERAYRDGELRDEHELVFVTFLDQGRNRPFALGVEVNSVALRLPAAFAQQPDRLGHRGARERHRGHHDLRTQLLCDLRSVTLAYGREGVSEHPLLETHHVLDAVDPRD